MQIILQEDVEKVGTRGEVVDVSSGYARNYLIPRKLAIEATPGAMKQLERIRGALAKKTANEREAAQKQAELLAAVTLRFARKAGENDQLFGSVTSAEIADALKAQGFGIDKRQIQLADAIKVLGEYQVTAKIYQEVSASFKVVVEKEG